MNPAAREAAWVLLSDLFVDTEHSPEFLRSLGFALEGTGFTADEIESILKTEVAPVCGRWMRWPSIGPWPAFDPDWVKRTIANYRRRPRFFRLGLWGLPGVREDWKIVRAAMEA